MEDLPVVKQNKPKNMYSLEKEIKRMIEEGADFRTINVELNKLRKYSY